MIADDEISRAKVAILADGAQVLVRCPRVALAAALRLHPQPFARPDGIAIQVEVNR